MTQVIPYCSQTKDEPDIQGILWDKRLYLINLTDPSIDAVERPAVSDVIHKQDALWDGRRIS